jgi:hypothetical protein
MRGTAHPSPGELLDLIYGDSTPCAIRFSDQQEHVPGVWHRPTVQAAARLDRRHSPRSRGALRADGLVGARIHSYGTLTASSEQLAIERWRASRPDTSSRDRPASPAATVARARWWR